MDEMQNMKKNIVGQLDEYCFQGPFIGTDYFRLELMSFHIYPCVSCLPFT